MNKSQNTCISVIKRVFSLLVAILILAISVSVFASSSNGIEFDTQPLTTTSTIINYGSSTLSITPNGEVYVFLASTSRNPSFYDLFIYYLSGSSYVLNQQLTYQGSSGTLLTDKGTYNYDYYYRVSLGTPQVPYYTDVNPSVAINNAISDLTEYINNYTPPEPPVSGYTLNISLPAGNIIIADISNTGSNPYYMETTSGTTGAVVKPGMNNIQIGYSNTVPESFTVPNSSWDYPSWSGAGSASVLGTYNRQSTQGDFALSNTDALKYVIITNPMYPNDNNASANRLNSDLNITIDKVNSYVIYSLQTGYVSGNLVGSNDGSQYIDYVYDEDTGEWVGTNQDGDPASPVWGGQNDFENTPTTINDWLENIAHQISSFFSGAIGAITTLSVAVKNFAGILMSLYVWLPSPVLSILSSAVMLAIVIGVIKVFI